ncbi:hypothetical protein SVA_0299 [Sulfurifustis variabilis]|uniref:DUF72 domain-containing protein n=1 Tax=Sulfurifustis variabilis TaxID=1675686 RepID=A0A1B4VAE1_9GAMM|nr:hypothetical protein SVA_0299 [Sulfurifustis variabilis]
MTPHVGTSGYSYAAWKGRFYPPRLPAADMLGYYAERFDTVEINASFYRFPSVEMLDGWAARVPGDFAFAFKAPRRITHDYRLGKPEDARAFMERVGRLGPRFAAALFQLPPSFHRDLPRLEGVLAALPRGARAAFEFRHVSWLDEAVYVLLEAHNAALCLADVDDAETPPLAATADWGYLRLRRADYSEAALADWARRVRGQGWAQAYVYFKHEDEARGPEYARRFKALIDDRGAPAKPAEPDRADVSR